MTHFKQGPDIENPELRGIIPRMTTHIFDYIMKADPSIEFLVRASYIEIYMEKIRDLLDGTFIHIDHPIIHSIEIQFESERRKKQRNLG